LITKDGKMVYNSYRVGRYLIVVFLILLCNQLLGKDIAVFQTSMSITTNRATESEHKTLFSYGITVIPHKIGVGLESNHYSTRVAPSHSENWWGDDDRPEVITYYNEQLYTIKWLAYQSDNTVTGTGLKDTHVFNGYIWGIRTAIDIPIGASIIPFAGLRSVNLSNEVAMGANMGVYYACFGLECSPMISFNEDLFAYSGNLDLQLGWKGNGCAFGVRFDSEIDDISRNGYFKLIARF